MLKSVQIKIVLIFTIIGILMIGVQGVLFTLELGQIQSAVANNGDIAYVIEQEMIRTRILSIILLVIFTIISVIVGVFVAKVIIGPIARLTKNAENIAKGGKY